MLQCGMPTILKLVWAREMSLSSPNILRLEEGVRKCGEGQGKEGVGVAREEQGKGGVGVAREGQGKGGVGVAREGQGKGGVEILNFSLLSQNLCQEYYV